MSPRLLLICALCFALLLSCSISRSSLWTDEAFSAWLASHQNTQDLSTSLLTGDSSDLQMVLYYVYLFVWTKLWGTSELALRSANIPFIVIFAFALVWTSWSVFKSRVAWVVAGLLPFVWHYASEARPYMAVLAFSTACLASLLGFFQAKPPTAAKKFPWICLTCILIGSLFHMLFLLAALPMVLLAAFAYFLDSSDPRWRYWTLPLAVFAVPFLALAGFFLFTFHRGPIDYAYPPPGAKQMASVIYELAGLFNFGPNRKFSLDFGDYILPLAFGGLAILLGVAILALPIIRGRIDRFLMTLGAAVCLSCVEVVAFSFGMRKQFDARHLAALIPIFLFLLIGLICQAAPRKRFVATILLGGAWFVADLRGAFLPVYEKEDFRGAVHEALSIHNHTGATIALVSDPAGAAYYGLDVRGPAPCYPIRTDCVQAFSLVPWHRTAMALYAGRWSRAQILSWLSHCREARTPVAIVTQLDRGREHRDSPWWLILAQYPTATRRKLHGFEIVILNTTSNS